MTQRLYETTHPWIDFKLDLSKLSHKTWLLLGEAMSKCRHIEGVPLQPEVATRLHTIYLSKGIHGTTSIEGNTLSEDEVRERIEGDLHLPASREYLGREIDNIVEISNEIWQAVVDDPGLNLSTDRIREFNRRILEGLPHKPEVRPGEVRDHSVTVGIGPYRGAPAEDCEYLLDKLSKWLNDDLVAPDYCPELKFPLAVLKAIMAHLYIAWIHPFGDGNGRTARVIELQLMVQAGAPIPTAHLLSDHYNQTRLQYNVELDKTSRPDEGFPIESFIQYALQGFVDELRGQIEDIRGQQFEVTWHNYVHEVFRNEDTPAKTRQRHVVLDMRPGELYSRSQFPDISPRVAREYSGKESKTVTRDLNVLTRRKLVRRIGNKYMANRAIIAAFMPAVAKVD